MQILFRADGNSSIGLGHVVRSLALAQMLQPRFTCIFAIRNPTQAIAQQIREAGCEVFDLTASINLETEARNLHSKFSGSIQAIVLDGYQFTTEYQQELRSWVKLVCLDDIHAIHFVANAIINPAGGVSERDYSKEPYTSLFTGPAYAFLRSPFLMAASQSRSIEKADRFFLNMGGADPDNHTLRILQQLTPYSEITRIEVVVGSAYQFLEELRDFITSDPSINLNQNLSAQEMCGLMQSCEAAILPPSSVAYEWCSVGGPLFLLQTAGNQKNLMDFLLKNQLAFSLGELPRLLPEILNGSFTVKNQLKQQKKYFDGKSPDRLKKIFNNLIYPGLLTIRKAELNDSMLLFNWINEPEVRKFSLNQAPIPLAMHTSWYQHKLSDQNCFIFITEILGVPMGMIRFDINNQEAVISYLLDKAYRGKGLGFYLLKIGISQILNATTRFKVISGLVQKHNVASVKAFEKAGFTATEVTNGPHQNLLKFKLAR